jgi:uncharacterized protein
VPPVAVASLLLVFVLCVWAHVGAANFLGHRLARRLPKGWGRAAFVAAWALFAVLFLGPLLLRALPRTELTGLISRVGTLWHLFLLLAAIPLGVLGLVETLRARAHGPRDDAPGAPATATPDAEGAPLVSREADEQPAEAVEVTKQLVQSPAPTLASPARREVLETALALGGAAVSASVFGYAALIARTDWEVVEVPVRLSRLPKSLDGFTIVQISDIHVGNLMGEATLKRGLGLVREQRADAIVVTGDIIDHERRYIPLAARLFGTLSARSGVFCIPGNHDHYTGAEEVMAAFEKAGLTPLVNRHVLLPRTDGQIVLAGVDDRWARGRHGLDSNAGPDLNKALSFSPPDAPRILLAHQPPFIDEYETRVDLQLSGHTHGGQINPVGPLLPMLIPYLRGHYQVGEKQLYVNRGFGTAGPPARVLSRPEITKIVLVSA